MGTVFTLEFCLRVLGVGLGTSFVWFLILFDLVVLLFACFVGFVCLLAVVCWLVMWLYVFAF